MTMRARRIEQLCTIPTHIPGDVHSTQLSRLNAELDRVKAECLALRAVIGLADDEQNETVKVLSELAAAFRIGEAAGWPAAGSPTLDADRISTNKPASQPPKGGHPGARRAVYVLQRRVTENIDSFYARRDNGWRSRFDLEGGAA